MANLQATVALARRVERAEIDFVAAIVGAGQQGGADRLEIGGGCALYREPGSPLNKVLALGVGVPVTDADLDALEAFYRVRRCAAQIELCPLAAVDLPARLAARGFVLRAFENELARSTAGLADDPRVRSHLAGDGIRVAIVEGGREQDWLDVVAVGFAAGESSSGPAEPVAGTTDSVRQVMRSFLHPDVRLFAAWAGEEAAGGAGSYVHQQALGIFGTATVPRFRRRGIQGAIVAAALLDGAPKADIAMATTEPGSTSQRTFERLGFQVLYTRAILIKDFA